MFIIVDHDSHQVIARSDGSLYTDCNKENISNFAQVISANNKGTFSVEGLFDPRFLHYPKRCMSHKDRTTLRY